MIKVIYNGRCPICSAEMIHYAAKAKALNAPLAFEDLHQLQLDDLDMPPDQAARRLHAQLPDGRMISGIEAFAAIWDHLPRFRWLAHAVRLPILGPLVTFLYDKLAAPLLYRMHLRRERLGNPSLRQ